MARRFAKVSEEEIEGAFFYPSDLPLFTSPSGDNCILLSSFFLLISLSWNEQNNVVSIEKGLKAGVY